METTPLDNKFKVGDRVRAADLDEPGTITDVFTGNVSGRAVYVVDDGDHGYYTDELTAA